MGLPKPIQRFTVDEYYRLEREAEYKSDYYDGEIFAMAGGTSASSVIAVNIVGELRQRLKGKPCGVYESNQRLKIKANGLRCYPDASVYRGKLQYDLEDPHPETAVNPTVLFEELSASTERYDRGFKSESYRQIESLRAYVFVSQTGPHVEIYERQAEGAWLLREVRGLEGTLTITAIGVELPLAEIYDRVEFTAPTSPPNEP